MSKIGLAFSGIFIAIAAYLILTQGIFGESFIALILGLPWVLVLSLFEFAGASGPLAVVMVLTPIAINAFLFYWIGVIVERLFIRRERSVSPPRE